MPLTIYFFSKPLILAAKPEEVSLDGFVPETVLISPLISQESISQTISRLQTAGIKAAVLLHPDVPELLEQVKNHFSFIQAAGGLVVSDQNRILLIFRKGKWDLPKGKLDPGENLEQCAVREVTEETGVTGLRVEQALSPTYHTYYMDGQHCLKESHWYLMRAIQNDDLVPQTEEDIEECIWADPAQLDRYLANTHPNIADVLISARPLLQGGNG